MSPDFFTQLRWDMGNYTSKMAKGQERDFNTAMNIIDMAIYDCKKHKEMNRETNEDTITLSNRLYLNFHRLYDYDGVCGPADPPSLLQTTREIRPRSVKKNKGKVADDFIEAGDLLEEKIKYIHGYRHITKGKVIALPHDQYHKIRDFLVKNLKIITSEIKLEIMAQMDAPDDNYEPRKRETATL